jgi:imidazolonepropionase-like amidohydrolase
MFKTISRLIVLAAIPLALGAQTPAPQRTPPLVLTHATLIDMTGAAPRGDMTVVVRDRKIAAIYHDGASPSPSDATIRDLGGAFLLPGLIDAHVHNATEPSGHDRRAIVEARLKRTLRGGVVAVRDMGGDARALADLARAAAAGDIESPEIRYSAIMAGPGFFDDPRVLASSAGVPPGMAPWTRAITDSTDLRQVIAEAKGTGATAIKMYADLGGPLAARAATEAKRQGLHVWAHLATFPAKPSDIVNAGVEVVSHAMLVPFEVQRAASWKERLRADLSITPADPKIQQLFALMKAKGTIFDPTLFVYRADSTAADTSRAKRTERRAIEVVHAAHANGIPIDAGTDSMCDDTNNALPNIHVELEMLVRAGLSPMEALTAATRTNAAVLGMSATHGTIEVGKAADLLVLSANPLTDIRNTRQIALVVRRGQLLQ